MSVSRKKGAADFVMFVVIAAAVVGLIMLAGWLGTAVGKSEVLRKVIGKVDFYVNLDDKGTEFSFLESKKGDYGFMEILGAAGSGMKIEGDMKTRMASLEQSLEKISRNSDKKNYYIAVIGSDGSVAYEKKNGDPPLILGTGAEDLFLKWPLNPKDNAITSGFGWRKDPVNNPESDKYATEFHGGIDIGGSLGDSVYSATDGEVIQAGTSTDFGNLVVIKYVSQRTKVPYYVYYGHLNSYSVRQGNAVKAGDEIGKVGSTGKSTGPHLHFEVRRDMNGDGAYAPDKESVNLCPYLANPKGGGFMDQKLCMKQCPLYENPAACEIDITVVKNTFDIPLVGGEKGKVELVLW
jgi:murein DD-endopeptidase MepM/ murein hydrolase activator NlpD